MQPQRVGEAWGLDEQFVTEELLDQVRQVTQQQGQDGYDRLLGRSVSRVQEVVRLRARQIAHLLHSQEAMRVRQEHLITVAEHTVSDRHHRLKDASRSHEEYEQLLASLEFSYQQAMSEMQALVVKATTAERETQMTLSQLSSDHAQINSQIEATVSDTKVLQQIAKLQSVVEAERPALLDRLEEMQAKHDHEVVEFQAHAAMQSHYANINLVFQLNKIKEQCEHRIRVCVEQTRAKLDAVRQTIVMKFEQLQLMEESRKIEEEDVELTEMELTEKDRLLAESKGSLDAEIEGILQPLNTVKSGLLVTVEEVRAIVKSAIELDARVKDLELTVLERREELMQAELALEQLRRDLAVAFEQEKSSLEAQIANQYAQIELAKEELADNERMLERFKTEKIGLINSLQTKESEMQKLLQTVRATEEAAHSENADEGSLKAQKATLQQTLLIQEKKFRDAEKQQLTITESVKKHQAAMTALQQKLDAEEAYVQATLTNTTKMLEELSNIDGYDVFLREHQAALLQIRALDDESSARQVQIDGLMEALSTARAQVAKLKEEVAVMSEVEMASETNADELRKQIDAVTAEILALELQHGLDPSADEDVNVKKLVASLAKKTGDFEASNSKLLESRTAMQQIDGEIKVKEADFPKVLASLDKVNADLHVATKDVAQLQEQRDQKSGAQAILVKELAELEAAHAQEQKVMQSIEGELQGAEAETELQKSNVEIWKERLEVSESELEARVGRLNQRSGEQQTLLKDITALEKSIEVTSRSVIRAKERFEELIAEVADKQKRLEEI